MVVFIRYFTVKSLNGTVKIVRDYEIGSLFVKLSHFLS